MCAAAKKIKVFTEEITDCLWRRKGKIEEKMGGNNMCLADDNTIMMGIGTTSHRYFMVGRSERKTAKKKTRQCGSGSVRILHGR